MNQPQTHGGECCTALIVTNSIKLSVEVSPTLNAKLTLSVIPCEKNHLGHYICTMLQQQLSMCDSLSNLQPSMTLFHYKNVSSSNNMCKLILRNKIHEESYHNDIIKHHMTLNTTFHVCRPPSTLAQMMGPT
jgi:hypothetical protein